MKLLCLIAFGLPLTVWGQITLTASDLPQAGTSYPLVDAAPPILTNLEAAGPGATWDFADLVPLNDAPQAPEPISAASVTAMFVFNNPFNSAYQADFFLPTTLPDFGVDLSGIIPVDGFSNFYKADGDTYSIVGLALGAAGFDVPVPYADVDELFPLPLTAGTTFASTSSIEMDIPETFGYWSDAERQVEVDGWGTLILPDGPHEVLRVRTEITADDSVYIPQIGTPFAFERSQVVYQWYGQGHGFPLLEVNAFFGIPSTARYLNLAPPSNAVAQVEGTPLNLHPNPVVAGATLSLEAPSGAVFTWLNALGGVVSEGRTTGPVTRLPTPEAPGMYFLHCGGSTKQVVVQ